MWESGHSFEEIDGMSLSDIGDVLGYWGEMSRIEERQKKGGKNYGV